MDEHADASRVAVSDFDDAATAEGARQGSGRHCGCVIRGAHRVAFEVIMWHLIGVNALFQYTRPCVCEPTSDAMEVSSQHLLQSHPIDC